MSIKRHEISIILGKKNSRDTLYNISVIVNNVSYALKLLRMDYFRGLGWGCSMVENTQLAWVEPWVRTPKDAKGNNDVSCTGENDLSVPDTLLDLAITYTHHNMYALQLRTISICQLGMNKICLIFRDYVSGTGLVRRGAHVHQHWGMPVSQAESVSEPGLAFTSACL